MRMIGGILVTTFYSAISTDDGGVLVMGKTTGYGEGSEDILLCRFSAEGDLEFSKLYGNTGIEAHSEFKRVSTGGYSISGESYAYGAGMRDFLFFTIQDDFKNCGNLIDN